MKKNKIIYDSVHGAIELPDICIKIINTIEFQRLREIYQLGACYYVFPGACHKRFEHSIGVCYLAGELISNIKEKQPELEIDNRVIELVQIAGLCHDLGHGPFSHLFDNEILKKYKNTGNVNICHENRSCLILEGIIQKYDLNISENETQIIQDLINPEKFILKNKWIYQIVSNCFNGIDVDKFDYISRDTKNIGLCYGFDFQRLIKLARVIDDNICYPIKLIFEINNLFQTRYRLHREIYNHPVVNSIEYMIKDILSYCDSMFKISDSINMIEEFIKLNDNILSIIENIEIDNIDILKSQQIIKNIKIRNLYKYIGEMSMSDDKLEEINNFNSIKQIIKEKDSSYIFPTISNEDDIIVEKLNLSYNFNPIDHVLFYDNDGQILKIDKKEYINTIHPISEKKIRLFCKNKIDVENLKLTFAYFKKIYL